MCLYIFIFLSITQRLMIRLYSVPFGERDAIYILDESFKG